MILLKGGFVCSHLMVFSVGAALEDPKQIYSHGWYFGQEGYEA